MSGKRVKLNIESPCATSWQGMTPRGNGRFCDHCAKQVVDLTSFTDEQLVRFFNNRSGEVCGRLNNHQLNRALEEKKLPAGSAVLARIAAGLLVAAPVAGLAQTPAVVTPPPAPFEQPLQSTASLKESQSTSADSTRIVIEGKIRFAEDGEPATGAVVFIEELGIGAVADIDGLFHFTFPDTLVSDTLLLQAKFIATETISIPITRDELLNQRILVFDLLLIPNPTISLTTVGMIIPTREYERRMKKAARKEKRMERKTKGNLE